MTATINASTSAGVVTTADTSGILQLQTNGTAALTVDASQNVGIGTASPASKLTVNNATATDYVTLTTAGSTKGVLADEAGDLIIKSAASLLFQTNGAIRARLNTTGAFVLAGGTTTADGIGITFPATQSASSDANTLDDYEEGTWTPNVYHNSSNNSTWGTKTGFYRKIGSVVYCWFLVDGGNSGTAGSQLFLVNVPFTPGAANPPAGTFGIWGANSLTPKTGNIFWVSSNVFQIYNGGNGLTDQASYMSGSFSYNV